MNTTLPELSNYKSLSKYQAPHCLLFQIFKISIPPLSLSLSLSLQMDFFKSVFSEDPDPPQNDDATEPNPDPDPNSAATWSFGGLKEYLALPILES